MTQKSSVHIALSLRTLFVAGALTALIVLQGCAGAEEATTVGYSCSELDSATTAWTPAPSGPSNSHHDSAVEIDRDVITATGPLTGASQAAPASREITVTIDMSQDLGANGSLSLIAETTGFPSTLSGNAYPLLVYLSDGVNEYINLARDTGGCGTSGFFVCGSSCSVQPSCDIANTPTPSAYSDRHHWSQHNIGFFGYSSVNTFPNCSGTSGDGSARTPRCAFTSHLFDAGKLRSGTGVTYTAKYVLLTSNYASMPSGTTAGLKVTAVKKKDSSAGGAVDLNIVIVGNSNIADSRTDRGKANLDLLVEGIHSLMNQAGSSIKIGAVNAVEWQCRDGGDVHSEIATDGVGDMISAGQAALPGASDGKAINIFLINSFTDSSSTLGIAGGIGGAVIHGQASSGVAVATFGELDSLNSSCSLTSCPVASQEAGFRELPPTVVHEVGHFLGLNHTSETDGTSSVEEHDLVYDTPMCPRVDPARGYITSSSCQSALETTDQTGAGGGTCNAACPSYTPSSPTYLYCPAVTQCGFNHLMWPFAKKFRVGTTDGDGNIISTNSSSLLNYNPLVQ